MYLILGGNHFCASDEAQNNSLIDAFGALASGNTDLSQQPLQVRVTTPQVFVFTFSHNQKNNSVVTSFESYIFLKVHF